MVEENLLDLLEDSRFKEVKRLRKKHIPLRLHWYLDEDYFSEELLGFHSSEIERMKRVCEEAYFVFEKATEKILSDRKLSEIGIPAHFEECIQYSWKNKETHPLLYGRFDINGGLGNSYGKIIEFNADTCSTLPETTLWQSTQLDLLKGKKESFNNLQPEITDCLKKLKTKITEPNPIFLGSSFGYIEDELNVDCVLDSANEAGFTPFYLDLEKVIFSDEGIFYPVGDEYEKVDVWFKMIPWDWIFNEEPELSKLLSEIIIKEKATVLNPAYTAIWQNKKFLAYITKYFPNNNIAETYLQPGFHINDYVKKPVYGRLGENIQIQRPGEMPQESEGDYGDQDVIYQRYHALPKDSERYSYQFGMFYTTKPSALNVRAQESKIITDDCEFMSHFIL